jgi:hypothetical protein
MTSWLFRLSEANDVSVRTIYENIQVGLKPGFDPDQTLPALFIDGLVARTLVPAERLQGLMLDPLKRILSLSKSGGGSNVFCWKCSTSGVRRRIKNQFCPTCLRTDDIPYFRLRWRFSFVTVCDVHRVPLWDSCPVCHGELDLQSVTEMDPQGCGPGIVFCRKCGSDLRRVATQTITPGEEETWLLVDAARRHQTVLLASLRVGFSQIQKGNPTNSHLLFSSLRHLVNQILSPRFIVSLGAIVRSEWPMATGLPGFTALGGRGFDELSTLERLVIMGITDWDAPSLGLGMLTVKGNQAKLPHTIHSYWKKRHHGLLFNITRSTHKAPE